MTVPSYQDLMLPVLRSAEAGERAISEVVEQLADELNLSEEDRTELIPSGKQTRFSNRTNWAKSYLTQAGLIESTGRGSFKLSNEGIKVLGSPPEKIDLAFLEQFPGYQEFKVRKGSSTEEPSSSNVQSGDAETPDEELVSAHREIEQQLALELLRRIRAGSPRFFENTIVALLIAMGYGGATEDVGRTLGQSGDRGVDGVIDQDALGVDQIYVQAKRYTEGNSVGAGDIRDFFGALNLKRASKGIFFTTSRFTAEATKTAADLGMRIVLIDGPKLAELLMKYRVGCRIQKVLELKEIDESFFEGSPEF